MVVIDVDGQDYWIWEALDWKPQVVVIEFNTTIDKNESKVMHKDSEHYKWRDNTSSYYGASVSALKKLGKKKGYTLIDVCGRNLFFILDELVLRSNKDIDKIEEYLIFSNSFFTKTRLKLNDEEKLFMKNYNKVTFV